MNSSSLFIVYLVVNSLHVVYLLRLSEGELKPLLTYLLEQTVYHLSRDWMPLKVRHHGTCSWEFGHLVRILSQRVNSYQ